MEIIKQGRAYKEIEFRCIKCDCEFKCFPLECVTRLIPSGYSYINCYIHDCPMCENECATEV